MILLAAPWGVGTTDKARQSAAQPTFIVQSLRIPMKEANPDGLESLLVYPNEAGLHPLAIITHGSPATAAERHAMTPQRMLPLAMEFTRRGWAAAIIMRRGYGDSGGRYAENIISCQNPDYMHAAKASAQDLHAAIAYLSTKPEIDSRQIIAVGASAGGLAVTALTADPPKGLVAAINFAGGQGHIAPNTVCEPGNLISTFWILGKKSRIPMLWVYAENDHFINSVLAKNLYEEFTKAGGIVTFISAAPFGSEGHDLFTMSGIPIWTKYLEDFLKDQNLALRSPPIPLPALPKVAPPQTLSQSGREAFSRYLAAPSEKAFAMNSKGDWGYEFGCQTLDEAKKAALAHCAGSCRIILTNNVTNY